MKHTRLEPIKKPPQSYEIVAFDTEGDGSDGGFILAAVWDDSGGEVFHNRKQLQRYLFSRRTLGKRIVAANLEYDAAVAFQPFSAAYSITLVNGKWIKVTYTDNCKHTWTIIDIQRIAPLSVAQMGAVVGIPKYSTPPTLTGQDAGSVTEWYCDTHKRLWCVECYCLNDARITYEFTKLLQDGLNVLGGEMKYTTAGCALDLWRRTYLKDDIPATTPEHNQLLRYAYYGGRVETYRVGTVYDVMRYDINSLYPYVMRTYEYALPSSYRRTDRPRSWWHYVDYSGVLCGEIDVPRRFLGLLPYRLNGRLYFPYGRLRGSWTLAEVRHALEHGAQVRDVRYILYANHFFNPFQDYVKTLYELRLIWKQNGDAREVVAKLMMNALSGKFGQRTDGDIETLHRIERNKPLKKYHGSRVGIIAGKEYVLSPLILQHIPPYVNVGWIADITSLGRIELYKYLSQNPDALVYCDTDSIHGYEQFDTGNELGQLKYEGKFVRGVYIAPKEYGGMDEKGTPYYKVKGVPKNKRSEYIQNGSVLFRQPVHTRTAFLYGLRIGIWEERTRTRHNTHGNRWHEKLTDYNEQNTLTYPYSVDDLAG